VTEPTDPIEPRPQPVVDVAGKLGGLASGAFIAVFVLIYTIVRDGISPQNVTAIGSLISLAVAAVGGLVGFLIHLFSARKAAQHVTPLSDPRDHHLRPLKVDPDFYGRHARQPEPHLEPDDAWLRSIRTDTQEIPALSDQPVRRIPEHVVPGKRLGPFPDAEWEAWKQHPRSKGRTDRMIAAIELCRSGGELPATDVPEQRATDYVAD